MKMIVSEYIKPFFKFYGLVLEKENFKFFCSM